MADRLSCLPIMGLLRDVTDAVTICTLWITIYTPCNTICPPYNSPNPPHSWCAQNWRLGCAERGRR